LPSPLPKGTGPLTRAAGWVAVAALSGLRLLPVDTAYALLSPLLILYPRIRRGQARRLRACFEASPFPGTLDLDVYYRSRLRLLLQGLKMHGEAAPGAAPELENMRIEGLPYYAKAAEGRSPVALVGLHSGLFELLHRIPQAPDGRPFLILTAEAFSPPLTGFMAGGREIGGKKILWVGGKRDRGLERGLRAVAAGKGIIALMADQHPGGAGEIEKLDLWGRIAVPYPARLLRFLAMRGFILVPVSTRVEGNGNVRFRFHPAWNQIPPLPAEPAGTGIDRDSLLADELPGRVRRFLEEAIAAAPEQWNWSYPKVVPASW